MEFQIIRAIPQDAEELARVMECVTAGMNNPAWFMDDDIVYIRDHIGHEPLKKEDL